LPQRVMKLRIKTQNKRQVIDITKEVQTKLGNVSGLANIFVLHTTAAITTADLDPGTDDDLLDALEGMLPNPPSGQWRHPHNPAHTPDHLLSSIVGPGVTLPINKGQLVLGTWQRIILIEFDGPRSREIEVTVIKSQ
jgi:secondary thiamine-phosphate synthase enzyme